jgi:flagellar biogenesis protein FliO
MKFTNNKGGELARVGGLAGWLLGRLRGVARPQPKLALLERITLAPRQSLSLVEADGRKFLIASSPEGAPAFYALDEQPRAAASGRARAGAPVSARVSW